MSSLDTELVTESEVDEEEEASESDKSEKRRLEVASFLTRTDMTRPRFGFAEMLDSIGRELKNGLLVFPDLGIVLLS